MSKLVWIAAIASTTPLKAQHSLATLSPPRQIVDASERVTSVVIFGGNAKRAQIALESAKFAWAAWGRSESAFLNDDLIGVKPLPLPATTVRKPSTPPDVGRLQRVYRRLVQLGLHEEAAEIARIIAGTGEPLSTPEIVPAIAIEDSKGRIRGVSHSEMKNLSWTAVAERPISCSFENASLDEVAARFQTMLGCVVRIEVLGGRSPRIVFSCRDLAAGKALERIVESCGWIAAVEKGEVVLRPPTLIPLRAERLPILR
jgi:hypothetical protein